MSDILSNIKSLRETTGAGFLDCKIALKENNNEIQSSIDYLRKKGLAKASKKSTRLAKEGAVGVFVAGRLHWPLVSMQNSVVVVWWWLGNDAPAHSCSSARLRDAAGRKSAPRGSLDPPTA